MNRDEILALDAEGLRLAIAQRKGAVLYQAHETMFMVAKPGWDMVSHSVWKPINWPEKIPSKMDLRDAYTSMYPNWAQDMGAAWILVEELQSSPHEYYFHIEKTPCVSNLWRVECGGWRVSGETAPLAICRCWLLCQEVKE